MDTGGRRERPATRPHEPSRLSQLGAALKVRFRVSGRERSRPQRSYAPLSDRCGPVRKLRKLVSEDVMEVQRPIAV